MIGFAGAERIAPAGGAAGGDGGDGAGTTNASIVGICGVFCATNSAGTINATIAAAA
jgi:hypothetical protein